MTHYRIVRAFIISISLICSAGMLAGQESPNGDWPANLPESTRPPAVTPPEPTRDAFPVLAGISDSGDVFFVCVDPITHTLTGVARVTWHRENGRLVAGISDQHIMFGGSRIIGHLHAGEIDPATKRLTRETVTESHLLPGGDFRTETWDGPIEDGWWRMRHICAFTVMPPAARSDERLSGNTARIPSKQAKTETATDVSNVRWAAVDSRVSWPFWWVLQVHAGRIPKSERDWGLTLTEPKRGTLRETMRLIWQPVYTAPEIPESDAIRLAVLDSNAEPDGNGVGAGVDMSATAVDAGGATVSSSGRASAGDSMDSEFVRLRDPNATPVTGILSLHTREPLDEMERSSLTIADVFFNVSDPDNPRLIAIRKPDELGLYIPVDKVVYQRFIDKMKRVLAEHAASPDTPLADPSGANP